MSKKQNNYPTYMILVRHGRRAAGNGLSPVGILDIKLTGEMIKEDYKWNNEQFLSFVSPLSRAQVTWQVLETQLKSTLDLGNPVTQMCLDQGEFPNLEKLLQEYANAKKENPALNGIVFVSHSDTLEDLVELIYETFPIERDIKDLKEVFYHTGGALLFKRDEKGKMEVSIIR